eukprot:TRINITY_DN206_c0_g1_i3.p1 TRINITY_DN206_c0_g1~~TRINITY_DN206_c0_g1_i3.p1  ORF type:complete len:354 (+),score=95.32 TRINITY_DN206_c0_g1_i3:224-1285(+)
MKEEKYRSYSNTILTIMGGLALLGAVAILTLFIVFVCISKPSFRDLSKFDFVVLCIDFGLLIVYGLVTFMKDPRIVDYGMKTWVCAVLLFGTVAVLNTMALYKHHSRVLPVVALSVPLGVAVIVLLVNSQFYFCEAVVPDLYSYYGRPPTLEEYSDFEDSGMMQGSIATEVKAPSDSPVKDHMKMDSNGNVRWDKTHFMIAIEDGITMKRRWRQTIGGIKSWLMSLSSSRDVFVSVFTFDTIGQNGRLYRPPLELVSAVENMAPSGASKISLEGPVNTYVEIMNDNLGKSMRGADWLHYGVLVTAEGSEAPKEALKAVDKFKRRTGVNFFLNGIAIHGITESLLIGLKAWTPR